MGVDISEPNTPPLVIEKVPPVRSSMPMLPSRPRTAKSAALGFDAVVSDYYWLQAIQAVG